MLPPSQINSLTGWYPVGGTTWQLAGQHKPPTRSIWTAIKPHVVAWIATKLWIGTPHLPHVSGFIHSHTLSKILGCHGAYWGPFSLCYWDNSGLEWISSPRALAAQYLRAMAMRWRNVSPSGEGAPVTSPGWNYPGQVPKLLEIRPLKTTRITIEDTETELSQQGQNYFCRRVCRHTGTASTQSRP
jgi:hypothetical protein